MSLTNLSQDTREILLPNRSKNVIIERPVSTENPIENVDVNIEGYSSSFGGQIVDHGFEPKEHEIENGNLQVKIPSPEVGGDQGADYLIKYSVEDSTGAVDTGEFFYQNGVYRDKDAGNLTNRTSAELERLSGTFADGQAVEDATNFADVDGDYVSMSRLIFDASGDVFTKHNGEPIPYFSRAGTVDFQNQGFSSRESTVILVIHWQQNFDQFFPVANVFQGEKKYLEIRNGKKYVELHSDFADSILYESLSYPSNILVAAVRINPEEGNVSGSVNREITKAPAEISEEDFASGTTRLGLDPEGKAENVKLFDALIYDEAISDKDLNRVAKQLSYFYSANLTNPSNVTEGKGSPKIQNHMFYDSDIRKYDVLLAQNPVTSYDVEADPEIPEWTHSRSAKSVAFNSYQKSAVGTENNDVLRLTSEGELIWEFSGHSDSVNAVENGNHQFVYSASEDGTVKKIGTRGNEIWNFGGHSGPVNDVALFRDLALYTASEDQTVRRVVENDGSENWVFTEHLAPVTCLAVDKNEIIYTGAANGELRVIDNSGNQVFVETPFSDPIEDVSVAENGLYVVGGDEIKKLQTSNGEEVWTAAASKDFDAVSVHPDGQVFAAAGNLVIEYENGSKITDFQTQRVVKDISVQPGSYEPHWKS